MSVGSWEPEGSTSTSIDTELLQALSRLEPAESPAQLAGMLTDQQLSALPPLMQLDASAWAGAFDQFEDAALLSLITVFTLAEELPNCDAGDKSPVIPIAKLLRQRGQRLDKELLQWIRSVSKNRFLPYGPL